MTLADAQAELALVNTAISSVLAGGIASYTINGRGATRLSLKDLRDQRRELESIVARLKGGMFSVAQFRNPD